mmetsp:Transcript_29865/g.62019  ORF Transcript_29865/g.62019 Transcript_29865/m.62019 type:complete len:233 (-) Transcript_29865:136-834(-)
MRRNVWIGILLMLEMLELLFRLLLSRVRSHVMRRMRWKGSRRCTGHILCTTVDCLTLTVVIILLRWRKRPLTVKARRFQDGGRRKMLDIITCTILFKRRRGRRSRKRTKWARDDSTWSGRQMSRRSGWGCTAGRDTVASRWRWHRWIPRAGGNNAVISTRSIDVHVAHGRSHRSHRVLGVGRHDIAIRRPLPRRRGTGGMRRRAVVLLHRCWRFWMSLKISTGIARGLYRCR